MQFIFQSTYFDLCVRLTKVFNIADSTVYNPALNIRVGKICWSTGNGLRKLDPEKE